MKQTYKFWRKDNFTIYWLPLVLYIIIMFILAVIPIRSGINTVLSFNPSMYVLHAIEFFILAVLIFRVFNFFKLEHPYIFTLVVVVLLGLLTETVQLLVSYRAFNPFDILADITGGSFILLKKIV